MRWCGEVVEIRFGRFGPVELTTARAKVGISRSFGLAGS